MNEILKIIFVEDVLGDAELIWHELKKNGIVFEKILVDNKKDFLKGLKTFDPDLIISDYSLPMFDGMSALLIRNELTPLIPFIMVTGTINEEVAVECLKTGADDYILKENLSRLVPAIINTLEKVKLLKEKKVAEVALLESEERYRRLVDGSPYAIAVHSKGKFVFVNPSAVKLMGAQSSEELIGKPILDIVHPDSLNIVVDRLSKLAKGEEVPLFEERIVKLDGSVIDVEIVGIPIIYQGQTASQVIVHDISERKRSEEALTKSELRFKQISENLGEWIWEVDTDGLYTYSSSAVKEILGYEADEVVNIRHFYDFFSPEVCEQLKQAAFEAFTGRENFRNFVNPNRHKDGREMILSTSGLPIYDNKGNFIGYRGVDTDITERKKAEQALAQSKREFQNYFESGSVGMSVTLPNKRWIEVNQKLCQLFGYSKEELLGMTWMDLTHPDDQGNDLELIQMTLDGKINNYDLEKRFVCRDGHIVHVNTSVVCERNPDGSVHHFLASYIDFTERVLAEERVKHERIMLRTLIDNIPDLIYVKDINCKKVIANIADVKSIGFRKEEEVIGKTDLELFQGQTGLRGYADDMEVISTGKSIIGREEDFVDINGKQRWLLTSKIPLHDLNRKITGLVGIGHDITLRKKSEEDLKQSYIFSESLLKTIPFGMDIVDEAGNVLFHSEYFKRIFGEAAIGKKCWDLYRDDKKQCEECPLRKGINIGETEAYESHGVLGNRIFEINHTGMLYEGKKAMLEIFQDITDRKINEAELISAKEKAEEGDRLKTAFLHNISHEIRTPMNAIVGFSALLSGPDIDEPTRKSYIDIIMQGSNHLLSIITDIVDISNIEANLVKITKKELNINSAIKSLYNQFLPVASEKNLKLICEYGLADTEAVSLTDGTKLTQILSNLINNALKFTDAGSIKVGYKVAGPFLEFIVSDTGIGIPDEDHKRIFDRFYQVQKSESRLYEGTGLGLAISRAYVELMGGKIWLSSEPGKGTSFYFTIPYEKKSIPSIPVVEKPVFKSFVFSKKRKILVAEDIDSNFKLIGYFLAGTNADLVRAHNGKEAVEMCKTGNDIDLVLMDIKMPVMDGYTATKLIREAGLKIAIIAQTAYADDLNKAIESGCSGFISKPFDKKGLLNKISEFI